MLDNISSKMLHQSKRQGSANTMCDEIQKTENSGTPGQDFEASQLFKGYDLIEVQNNLFMENKKSYDECVNNFPRDLKNSVRRKDEYISRLLNTQVSSSTQCMQKQSEFYSRLSGYNQKIRMHQAPYHYAKCVTPLVNWNLEPEISVVVNNSTRLNQKVNSNRCMTQQEGPLRSKRTEEIETSRLPHKGQAGAVSQPFSEEASRITSDVHAGLHNNHCSRNGHQILSFDGKSSKTRTSMFSHGNHN